LKPRQVVAALERCSFVLIRVVGSHYQLFNDRTRRHTTVPHHNRDFAARNAVCHHPTGGLTRDEFLGLL
jgi:predicted RNA binding protein YcfA (HicA-like mRNA interferase family)